jgi:hypothetical protein
VREASVAELAAVPKVTPKLAQRIHEFFHPALAVAAVQVEETTAPGTAVGSDRESTES